MRGLFTLLIATIAALVGGVIGFQLGVTSNIGAAGGTVVWHAGFPFFGFFFPFLFFFLFIGLLFAAFGGRRRGWGGPGWGVRLRLRPGRRPERPAPAVDRRRPPPPPRGGSTRQRDEPADGTPTAPPTA